MNEVALLKPGTILVGHLSALTHHRDAEAGLTTFALELMPRISRVQSMDVLSSQNNLAGCKAVIDGVQSMRPGSVIIDPGRGGGRQLRADRARQGRHQAWRQDRRPPQCPGRLPKDATSLYARNVFDFLDPHVDKQSKALSFKWDDETVQGGLCGGVRRKCFQWGLWS